MQHVFFCPSLHSDVKKHARMQKKSGLINEMMTCMLLSSLSTAILADENECKYRPCDVFAHCTNTMGSFYCSCFPGYDGDGFTCHGKS